MHYSLYGGVQRKSALPRLSKIAVILTVAAVVFGSAAGVGQLVSLPAHHTESHAAALATTTLPEQVSQLPASTAPAPQPADSGALAIAAAQTATTANTAKAWSVSVYDIDNNKWLVRLNDTQQMSSASLYKLYVAFALAQKVPFAQWSTKQVAGHSVKDCVDLMIRVSDNTCGEAVAGLVGYSMIDRVIHSYGFALTSLNSPGGQVTTANDTTRFMADLYQGQLFDPEAGNFILNSLARQLYRSAIPAGCPGCTVYNKTGLLSSVAHDTAIVKSDAGTYAVTIMSVGGSYQKIASVEQALQTALTQAATLTK